ncbi:MAG: heme A synthase [Gemmatimonadota bacterium]
MTAHGVYRRLAWSAVGATVALMALGGVVRVTGSGMGCGDDWPLCHGRLVPPLDGATLIEYGHRLAALVVSLLVTALGGFALLRLRAERRLRDPALLATALLVLQVLLGAVTVKLGLPPASVVLHLAVAMLLLAVLLTAAIESGESQRATTADTPVALRRLATGSAALGLVTVLAGGLVANLDAGPACQGFPLCNGTLLPEGGSRAALHWLHRLLAFSLLGLLALTGAATLRARPRPRALARLAAAALAVGLAQVALAAAMVLRFLPPGLRAAHMAVGVVLWALLVALHARARRGPAAVPAAGAASEAAAHERRPPAPRPLRAAP